MLKRRTLLFFLLCVQWIVLSSIFQAKFLVAGVVASALIAYFCAPLLTVSHKGKEYCIIDMNVGKYFSFFAWLLWQILLSSIEVSKAVIFSRKYFHPQIVKFKCDFQNPAAIVMLTNSIILTPGTVTVDVTKDNVFIVHALTKNSAESLNDGQLVRRIAAIYNEEVESCSIISC